MLKFSLLSLVVVGVISIFMIVFGSSDYRDKAISTFLLFAAFALFAWIDVKDDKHAWYSFIGSIGNIYMVLLGMYVIWGGGDDGWFGFMIPYQLTMLVIQTRIGVFGVQRMETFARRSYSTVSAIAQPTSYGIALITLLLTLPTALTDVTFGEVYWKFTSVVILLTALALIVVLILNAAYGSKDKQRKERLNNRIATARQNGPGVNPPAYGQSLPQNQTHAGSFPPGNEPSSVIPRATEQQPQYPNHPPQQSSYAGTPANSAPSWPVFPDGNPLPRKQNGRPDWMALSAVVAMHIQADAQWFPEEPTQ